MSQPLSRETRICFQRKKKANEEKHSRISHVCLVIIRVI